MDTTENTIQASSHASLKAENVDLRSMVDSLPGVFWAVDVQYRLTGGNALFFKTSFLTYGVNLSIGEDALKPFSEAMKQTWKRHYDKAFNGESFSVEESVPLEDGVVCWEAAINPIRDNMGKVTGAAVFAREVRERREIEDELLKIRAAVQGATDAIGMSDQFGRHFYQNRAFTKLFGYSLGEVRRMNPQKIYHDPAVAKEVFEMLLRGGSWQGEVIMRARDGRILNIFLRANAIFDHNKKLRAIMGVHSDITEKKISDSKQAHLTAAIEQAGEAFVLLDSQWTVEYVNPAFELVTGFSSKDVVGFDARFLSKVRKEMNIIQPIINDCEKGLIKKGRVSFDKGRSRTVQVDFTVSPVRNQEGRVSMYVAVIRDVTQEAALHEKLRHAQKMEAIGTLAGGMAHDFNNILQVMNGYAEMLLDEAAEKGLSIEPLKKIRDSGMRAARLVEQMLNFGRRSRLKPSLSAVGRILNSVLDLIEKDNAAIQIQRDIKYDAAIIEADPVLIREAFIEICQNACQAMEKGGVLKASLEQVAAEALCTGEASRLKSGAAVKIIIEDTGSGMDDYTLTRAFDPFFTTRKVGEGAGMGLASVHGIIESAGGSIDARSQLGMGTTIVIFFPEYNKFGGETV